MTFDSCQGEERDVILYSIVATSERDRLGYIFPKVLDSENVEENIRQQRLNMGLSRSKEVIHFFLSKPIDEFSGTFGMALRHFRGLLYDAHRLPSEAAVDPNSPMEKRLLGWIGQTTFFQTFKESIEVDAQFCVGDYLRQMNRNYKHPAYKVDFLLKMSIDSCQKLIVIEYDGFKEHFDTSAEVNEFNYETYMKPDDIEREKTLESYGYKFVRLNRFNTGTNPIESLDKKLWSVSGKSSPSR